MILLAGYTLLLVINWHEYKPKFSPLNIALSIFLLSFTVSTFVGVDWYHSFWDNHERMLGLFTILHYFAFYIVCGAVFKDWTDWKWALRMFVMAGSIVIFIGMLQRWVNPNLLLNQGSDRVSSTLGNPIYVSAYGLFLTFASLLLFAKEKDKIWKWVSAVMAVFGVLGILLGGSRGPLLGLCVGLAIMLCCYTLLLKDNPKTTNVLRIVSVVFILSLLVLFVFRHSNFVQNLPAIGRAFNTSLSDVENSARWIAWQNAIKAWKEMPIFGWGPNNYFYAFNKYYNPLSLNFGYGETWFDNAHNIILNTLAVQGLVGLLSYLAIFLVGVLSLIKAYKGKNVDIHLLVIGSAFLIGHLVQNVTVFEDPTSYLYLMFWLALISRMTYKLNLTPEQIKKLTPAPDKNISAGLIITVGVMAIFLVFVCDIQPARANQMTLSALRELSTNPSLGLEAMKQALKFNSPHIDDIRSDLSRTAVQMVGGSYQNLGKDKSNEILSVTEDALLANITLHPLDIRNHLTLAQVGQLQAMVNNDVRYLSTSQMYLEKALALSQHRQQIIYSLANIDAQLGQVDVAESLLNGTISDNPKIAESYWRLAYIYKITGKMDQALKMLNEAQKNGVVFVGQDQDMVNQILAPAPTTTAAVKAKTSKK